MLRIPELDAGVLGATTLNLYSNACNELLAHSHAAYGLEGIIGSYTALGLTVVTKETRYLYLAQPTLYYAIALKCDKAGESAVATFRDLGASADLGTASSDAADWTLVTGTIDLTAHIAAEGYEVGDMLRIAVRLNSTRADATASLYVFSYGSQGVTTGWTALPAFTDDTASDEDDFNDLRTDIGILQEQMLSPVNALTTNKKRQKTSDGSNHTVTVLRAVYRYRGDGLWAALEGKGGGGDGWEWGVDAYTPAGVKTVLYTSGGFVSGTADYALRSAAIDLSAAGLVVGDWYRVEIWARRDDTWPVLTTRRAWLVRTSSGTPGGSWAVPPQWEHKDTTVNNANLSKLTDDLTELYTAGDEELWGQTPALLAAPDAVEGDRDDRTFTGVHRYRWLCVKAHNNEDPYLIYGTDLAERHSLTVDRDLDWQVYDLGATPLPLGGYYAVAQCDVAFESQEPCNNA